MRVSSESLYCTISTHLVLPWYLEGYISCDVLVHVLTCHVVIEHSTIVLRLRPSWYTIYYDH